MHRALVAAKTTHPVLHVVHGEEQDVRLGSFCFRSRNRRGCQRKQSDRKREVGQDCILSRQVENVYYERDYDASKTTIHAETSFLAWPVCRPQPKRLLAPGEKLRAAREVEKHLGVQ